MRTGVIVAGVVGGLVLAGVVGGCATSPQQPSLSEPARAPADPLYRHPFTTPWGRTWDFQVGGYEPSER